MRILQFLNRDSRMKSIPKFDLFCLNHGLKWSRFILFWMANESFCFFYKNSQNLHFWIAKPNWFAIQFQRIVIHEFIHLRIRWIAYHSACFYKLGSFLFMNHWFIEFYIKNSCFCTTICREINCKYWGQCPPMEW